MKKFFLPLALAALGIAFLIGCIPIPGNFQRPDGKARPEESLGEAKSKKPLKKGVATRDGVLAALGAPQSMTPDGRTVYYDYMVTTGYLIGPLCALPSDERRYLRIDFGADNVFRSFKVTKKPEIDQAQLIHYHPTSPANPPPVEREPDIWGREIDFWEKR